MLASVHGPVLSNALFVLLLSCLQDLPLCGNRGAKTFLLEDNENICCFSSKTKYRLKQQGWE